MKQLISYIILINVLVLWAIPNETKAQTCDVTLNVSVDFWYYEGQYAVVDQYFNFVLPYQSFTSSYQSRTHTLPGLTDGDQYYVVLSDSYGDGGISGNVVQGGTSLVSWSAYSYSTYAYNSFIVACGGVGLANDACAGALPIACGDVINGSTTAATTDFESFCGTSNGSAGGVWYEFTGDGSCVELSTCNPGTNYDTKLRVYEGACGSLSCVVGNDDACSGFRSTVDFATTSGVQYSVLVHGYGSSAGDFELSMTCSSGPWYDDVCAAPDLGLGIVWGWDNTCSSAQPGEVSPGAGTGVSSCDSQDGWCSFETGVQSSVWFTFQAPASGCVSVQSAFDASQYDTQLAIWEVGDCSDWSTFTEMAANDDGGFVFSSYIQELSCLTPGATYYIQVDGYNGTEGSGAILITDCGNDPLAAATDGCGIVYEGIGLQYSCATINGSATGGFAPYTYSWSNGSTDESITVCPTATTT